MALSSSEPTKNRQSLLTTRNAVTYVQIEKTSKIFKPLLFSTEIERYTIPKKRFSYTSRLCDKRVRTLLASLANLPHPRVLRARTPRFFFRARK